MYVYLCQVLLMYWYISFECLVLNSSAVVGWQNEPMICSNQYLGRSKEEEEAVLAMPMEHRVLVHRAVHLQNSDTIVLEYRGVQRFVVDLDIFQYRWSIYGKRRGLCCGHVCLGLVLGGATCRI